MASSNIRIKRVYETPSPEYGARVLVDRLWPRGIRKEQARITAWMKDLAPSNALRHWFHRNPARWAEFRRRYRKELRPQEALRKELVALARRGRVTLLYASRDHEHNNASALQSFLKKRKAKPRPRRAKSKKTAK